MAFVKVACSNNYVHYEIFVLSHSALKLPIFLRQLRETTVRRAHIHTEVISLASSLPFNGRPSCLGTERIELALFTLRQRAGQPCDSPSGLRF